VQHGGVCVVRNELTSGVEYVIWVPSVDGVTDDDYGLCSGVDGVVNLYLRRAVSKSNKNNRTSDIEAIYQRLTSIGRVCERCV
jgi:hypothetical protein